MSKHIGENRDFLSLILSSTPEQKRLLLNSITPSQTALINEIFYNLLHIEHSIEDRKYLRNKISLIKKLADSKRTIKYRQSLIRKHRLTIIKIVDHFANQLKQLL